MRSIGASGRHGYFQNIMGRTYAPKLEREIGVRTSPGKNEGWVKEGGVLSSCAKMLSAQVVGVGRHEWRRKKHNKDSDDEQSDFL